MNDQTIKEALLAISNHANTTLESYIALSTLIANRMPGLSPDERAALLTALESDKKRLGLLKDVLQKLG